MAVKAQETPETRTITVAHSPDSDDAFMFYGLATNKLETEGLKFEHTLKDIQTLNEDARNGVFDVTAISFHAYAYVADKYALLPHGASIGDKYGPILVSKEPREADEIGAMTIAIPGELPSALSRCGSTTSRSTTANAAAKPSNASSPRVTRPASSRTRSRSILWTDRNI